MRGRCVCVRDGRTSMFLGVRCVEGLCVFVTYVDVSRRAMRGRFVCVGDERTLMFLGV